MSTEVVQSGRIDRLRQELEGRETAVLDEFWAEVEANGSPLIESIEGDSEHSLVTYLFREGAEEEIEKIIVYATFPTVFWRETGVMQKLPGTDVWYLTAPARNNLLAGYCFLVNDNEEEEWSARIAKSRRDPYARKQHLYPGDDWHNIPDRWVSILELPNAITHSFSDERADVAQGQVDELSFTGTKEDQVERRVWVYTPVGYAPENGPYDLLVFYDGFAYLKGIPGNRVLDNMIADGKIPPVVAVFIDHKDRYVDLFCHDPFVNLVVDELLPHLRSQYAITDDPQRSIIAGSSIGGLTSIYTAFKHPHVFGKVLCQCGSFWWDPSGEKGTNWLGREMAAVDVKPLKIYMELGRLEGPSTTRTCNLMYETVRDHGYDVVYRGYEGGHDYIPWLYTLPNALMWLYETE